jgi:hypothetical protein
LNCRNLFGYEYMWLVDINLLLTDCIVEKVWILKETNTHATCGHQQRHENSFLGTEHCVQSVLLF